MQFEYNSGMQPQGRVENHMVLIIVLYILLFSKDIAHEFLNHHRYYLPLPGKPIPFSGSTVVRSHVDTLFGGYTYLFPSLFRVLDKRKMIDLMQAYLDSECHFSLNTR
jgi:hypothetical protein